MNLIFSFNIEGYAAVNRSLTQAVITFNDLKIAVEEDWKSSLVYCSEPYGFVMFRWQCCTFHFVVHSKLRSCMQYLFQLEQVYKLQDGLFQPFVFWHEILLMSIVYYCVHGRFTSEVTCVFRSTFDADLLVFN